MKKALTSCALGLLVTVVAAYGSANYAEALKDAQAKYKAREYGAAREAFLQALDLTDTPTYIAQTYSSIGNCYKQEKDYENARRYFEKILLVENVSPAWQAGAYGSIAEMCGASADYARQIEVYEKMLSLKKGINKDRVQSFLAAAKKNQEKALTNTPGHPYFKSRQLFAGAFGHYLDFDLNAAQKLFQPVAQAENGHPGYRADAQFLIGYIYYIRKDYAKARVELQKVPPMKDAPQYLVSDALRYIGYCYFNEQNYSAAREAFQKVVELKAEHRNRITQQHQADSQTFLKRINNIPAATAKSP